MGKTLVQYLVRNFWNIINRIVMKRLITILSFTLFVISCNSDEDLCLVGSGKVDDYVLNVDTFDRIALLGPVNLQISQGTTQEVVVQAEQEIFGHMSYKVSNKTLEIGFEDNIQCFETNFGVWVNITVPDLTEIFVSGVSEIVSEGDIDFKSLDIIISGTSEISLSGKITKQGIESSGVVTARNFGLNTEITSIKISGTGDIEIQCSSQLDIIVSGAATIKYKGQPQITQNVSGTLDLQNAN